MIKIASKHEQTFSTSLVVFFLDCVAELFRGRGLHFLLLLQWIDRLVVVLQSNLARSREGISVYLENFRSMINIRNCCELAKATKTRLKGYVRGFVGNQ